MVWETCIVCMYVNVSGVWVVCEMRVGEILFPKGGVKKCYVSPCGCYKLNPVFCKSSKYFNLWPPTPALSRQTHFQYRFDFCCAFSSYWRNSYYLDPDGHHWFHHNLIPGLCPLVQEWNILSITYYIVTQEIHSLKFSSPFIIVENSLSEILLNILLFPDR